MLRFGTERQFGVIFYPASASVFASTVLGSLIGKGAQPQYSLTLIACVRDKAKKRISTIKILYLKAHLQLPGKCRVT